MQQCYSPYQTSVTAMFLITPFGSAMPTRAWTDVSRRYRYGFNGMEKDDEVKGEGNSYDFGARIYDSRLGRWLAVDPLYKLYFGSTTYSFALNNPIILIDIDGRVIFDSEGNKVTITFNSQTGAIDKIEGTKDAKLMELIKSTHSNGAEGKAQIEKLNADNVKANITIHSGGVIFKSPKGNYGEVQGLSGASEPSKDDKDNGFNEILHIHIMNYDGIAKEGDLTVDDLENYEILDEYGRPIKKVSKKEKEKIVSDINKNKGVETHEEHQASFEGMTDEEIEIYKKKVPIEEKNNQTQANVNTLIYEAANSSEQAKKPNTKEGRTAGEREGKKAVVRSYKERNK